MFAQARQLDRTEFPSLGTRNLFRSKQSLNGTSNIASRPQRGPLGLNECGIPSFRDIARQGSGSPPDLWGWEEEEMLRAYLNYGLIASVVIWAAIVGVMAYRLNESPWRWAFVGLVFAGGLTVAVILWIKKYVDRLNEAEEKRESKS